MIIDNKYKHLYIAVPKTGSISIQFSLGHGDNIPEPDDYHQSLKTAISDNPVAADYFKFAFVRNPWDRLLSLYNDFTVNRVYQYSGLIKHDKPLLSEFADFNDMCVRLCDSEWRDNIFFTSQFDLLSISDKIGLDYVGRFENLFDDFTKICSILNIDDVVLECRNTSKVPNVKYRNVYSVDAKNAIAKLYSRDIETFGYEF